ncbi:cbf nf-y family transcription [Stagonosporopsis vannaccii]|nr:cbf nf-y family transcription [Stagonosporopsis vannaccii]
MASWAPQSPDLSSYHSADAEPVHPQHQGYRGSVSHAIPQGAPPLPSPSLPTNPSPYSTYAPYSARKENMQDADYIPEAPLAAPQLSEIGNGSTGGSMLPPNIDSIIIKNHFPVARIKRIMQADDDVGKVAQVTPVVVSKALELFMISLVTKAAAEAKQRNSKRVGAIHLKQAITRNEQFDFLNDIVSKVADAPEKTESDAMDEGKKKKATRGRRKKADDDDDF